MRRPPPIALAVLAAVSPALAGCAPASAAPDASGTWIGRLHTVAGTCPDGQDSDLVVSDRHVTFVPGDGVLVLRGTRDPARPGLIHAQLLGRDMNHHSLPMVFDGTTGANGITGTYGTPTCRAGITLHRPTHTAVQRFFGN